MFFDHPPAEDELLHEIHFEVLKNESPVVPDGVVSGVEVNGVRRQGEDALALLARAQDGPEIVEYVFESSKEKI